MYPWAQKPIQNAFRQGFIPIAKQFAKYYFNFLYKELKWKTAPSFYFKVSGLKDKSENILGLKIMSPDEAQRILQCDAMNLNEIVSRCDKLMKDNDPAKGGSFFLQCKILAAEEILLAVLGKMVDAKTGEIVDLPEELKFNFESLNKPKEEKEGEQKQGEGQEEPPKEEKEEKEKKQ